MYRLIPHFIQENYTRGIYRGEFHAAGLFLDVSGFSAMTEELMRHGTQGAETLAQVMQAVFDPLAVKVYAHGGMIINMAGDAFTAMFPATQAEDGADEACLQALAAAWSMQQQIASLQQQETPFGIFSIRVKIGLAIGEISWGILTSMDGHRAVYYFQGPAVDGCAEAEHHAAGGEIVMSEKVRELLAKWIIADGCLRVEPVADHFRLAYLATDLPQEQSYTIPEIDPNVLRLFFPAIIAERAHSGEFRQIVNLFINLPTVRSEAQLVIFAQNVFDLMDRYGGVFKRIDFGDKGSYLFLFWGAPIGHEDDVERALNFLVDLQSLTSIPLHAGVTYQTAYAGFIRTERIEEYTCFGWAVNLAARFMMGAPRGEIWVDEAIARRARGQFEIEYKDQRPFKGFAHPQNIYILNEKRQEVESFYSGDLVGREEEIGCLGNFVTPIWQGRYAGALVVWGEAGMGKSRLVHEFQARLSLSRPDVLWAVCQSDKILREPLNPFRYWLMRFFDQSENQAESRNKRNFNRLLDQMIGRLYSIAASNGSAPDLADELDRTRSFLGALIQLNWPDSLYEQLDPQGRYENTQIALSCLLKALSLQQPLILFIEDVHWLDDDSRLFLPYLDRVLTAEQGQPFPIAIVSTARLEAQLPVLGENLEFSEIDLARISEEGIRQLAGNQLKAPISVDLLHLLTERAEGNPFFAEQIIRYLEEAQLLEQSQQGWRLIGKVVETALPVDVGALLVARLDRLEMDVRSLVQAASVIGREFDISLLERMRQDDLTVQEKVKRAAQAAIWARLDDLRCLFQHILLRDAAYTMMLHAQRKDLHAAVVLAMESLHTQDLLPLHYSELAFHSQQAGLIEKACFYLQQAGNAARDVFRNALAAAYYSQALDLIPESIPDLRYQVLLEHEAICRLLGNREEQKHDLLKLSELADRLESVQDANAERNYRAAVGRRWADFTFRGGDFDRAINEAESAYRLAEAANNLPIMIETLLLQSNAFHRLGKYELATRQSERALELARQLDDLPRQGEAWNMLGLIALEAEEPTTVSRYFEESLKIAQKTGKLWVEAMVWNNLGILAGMRGDFSRAQEHYEKALHLARETGNRRGEGLVLGNLGWIAGSLGDYSAARSFCEQNLRISREGGDMETQSYNLINLCSIAERQSDFQTARVYAEQALDLSRQTRDRSAEAWACTYAGHVYMGTGQLDVSTQYFLAGLEIRQELGQRNLACEPGAGLALAWETAGTTGQALQQVENILAYLDGGGTLDGTDEPLRISLNCFRVLEAAGDPRASSILETAYRQIQERAEKITNEESRRSFRENVPYHREIIRIWEHQAG